MDWFPAFMTLVGVLVGVGVQELRIWREKKDKYKDMVFGKRLDVHQGAYYQCRKLTIVMMPFNLMKVGGVDAAIKEIWEAMDWMNKNALYLDEDSREKMDEFQIYANNTASKYVSEKERKNINTEEEEKKLGENLREVLSCIQRGVGAKYLPGSSEIEMLKKKENQMK